MLYEIYIKANNESVKLGEQDAETFEQAVSTFFAENPSAVIQGHIKAAMKGGK
jgi:hypothetical protein